LKKLATTLMEGVFYENYGKDYTIKMKLKQYLYKTLIKNDQGIIALKNRINIIYDLLTEKYERYINTTHKKRTAKK